MRGGEGEIRKRQEIEPVCGGCTWENTCHSFSASAFRIIWNSKAPRRLLVPCVSVNTCDGIQKKMLYVCSSLHWCILYKVGEVSVDHVIFHLQWGTKENALCHTGAYFTK